MTDKEVTRMTDKKVTGMTDKEVRRELECVLVTQVSGKVGGNVLMSSFEKRERSERGLGGRGSSSTDHLFLL